VDTKKDAAILAAARQAFLAQPYDRVNMDRVAAQAGVSKVTIYNKYGSKDGMFVAAMNEGCAAIYDQARIDIQSGKPLDKALTQLGIDFMMMILEAKMTALHGVMTQVAQQKPELTQVYYRVVVENAISTLAETLLLAHGNGKIICQDPRQAAVQFIAMIQGVYRYEAELGVSRELNVRELEHYIEGCVAIFLRGYHSSEARAA
jgi:TetR/AcrR family transcriptional regulator, mexJK operon transcriptional repressor